MASNAGKKFDTYKRGSLRLARELWGKPDVFCAHPFSEQIPAFVDFSKLTATASGTIVLHFHNFPTGDCEAVVKVADQDFTKVAVGGDVWKTVEVPFNRNSVGIQVRATGWWNEHAFITYEIKDRKEAAPIAGEPSDKPHAGKETLNDASTAVGSPEAATPEFASEIDPFLRSAAELKSFMDKWRQNFDPLHHDGDVVGVAKLQIEMVRRMDAVQDTAEMVEVAVNKRHTEGKLVPAVTVELLPLAKSLARLENRRDFKQASINALEAVRRTALGAADGENDKKAVREFSDQGGRVLALATTCLQLIADAEHPKLSSTTLEKDGSPNSPVIRPSKDAAQAPITQADN